MKLTLTPYLNFNGQTADAMRFYQSIFGGELKMQTFAEAHMPTTPETKNNIIHADLQNGALSFMASDGDIKHPVHMGDNIHMSLMGDDEKTLTGYFNALALGGMVNMPLAKQFWGDIYGQLTDKFGVHWMVNISAAASK
jgi:PhnB protein